MNYECKRCFHKTKQKIEMKRHLERKKKCLIKNIKYLKYSDSELYDISMEKIKKCDLIYIENDVNKNNYIIEDEFNKEIFNEESINEYEINNENHVINHENHEINNENHEINNENHKINEIINENNQEIIDENNYKNIKNKFKLNEIKYICNNCDLVLHNKSNLNRHKKKCNNKKVINITNNTLNQNIININLNIPRPFDEDWDITKIDKTLRNMLLLSNMKYTKTLEYILDNDANLNVVINDESNSGIVYTNGPEKFRPMKIDDIINKSMDKLHKQLNSFYINLKDEKDEFLLDNNILDLVKDTTDKKYESFKNNKIINEKVKEFITNIYNNKRNETLKVYELLCTDDEKALLEGY